MPMIAAPSWRGSLKLSSREFVAVTEAFLRLVRKNPLGLRDRLRAGCRLLETLYEVQPGRVRGERFEELMSLLSEGAVAQAGEAAVPGPSLRRRMDKLFGQWLFLHAVADDPRLVRAWLPVKILRSWRRYGQSRAFVRGCGPVPEVCPGWPRVAFEQVAAVQPAPEDALEPVCRFIQIKLDAHAFAGPAYYCHDVIHGLTALWLFPAIAGWFARLRAAGAGRAALIADDVVDGVRTAAATFGVSPVFARPSERFRLRALAVPDVPSALFARYGP